jgi:outer membrane beta-barrel protein
MNGRTTAPSLLMTALAAAALTTALVTVPTTAAAQSQQPGNEQVIVPEVDRREVKLPRYPSNDFEIGLFTGTYATENFGSSVVGGVRLGYHITEDFFVQGVYAQTKVSDEAFRQVLPGGVFADEDEKLAYYNLSVGYNVLPGEVFLGRKRAKATAVYVIGGIGSTKFNDQDRKSTRLNSSHNPASRMPSSA